MADRADRMKARLPRGFVDRHAADIRAVDAMTARIRAVYELYGFEPVEQPMVEYTDALGKFLPDQDRPNRRIVEAAARLFRESGYEGVKIETIAEQAGVSVGTIYNYYESKGDVLVAVVSLEVNEVIAAGEMVLSDPPADAVAAVCALFDIYLRHSLHYLSKEMWRAAMSMSTLHPQSPLGRHYSDLDAGLCRQVCRLLAKLKARGSVAAWVDVDLSGRILFNTMNMMFIDFVKDEAMETETVVRAVEEQTRMVVSLLVSPRR